MSKVEFSRDEMLAVSEAVGLAIQGFTDAEFVAGLEPEEMEMRKSLLPILESVAAKLNSWLAELQAELPGAATGGNA